MSDAAVQPAASTGAAHRHPMPMPMPPPMPPPEPSVPKPPIVDFRTLGKTVFDGGDYSPNDRSFDIDGAAARAVAAYDRDGDGAIDLSRPTMHRPVVSSETTRHDEDGSHSIAKLAKEADRRGNGDGRATAEEIAAVIRSFDGSRRLDAKGAGARPDGRLEDGERSRFLQQYGEADLSRPMPEPRPGPWPKPIPMPDPHDRCDQWSTEFRPMGHVNGVRTAP